MEPDLGNPAQERNYSTYFPWLTIALGIVAIALFAGINLDAGKGTWEAFSRWGSPHPDDLYRGQKLWVLITSNFLHVEVWHIAFNLYWWWIFGKKIEFEEKIWVLGGLILSSGVVASVAQLTFSETTGIGMSGIGYAMFGFIWVKTKTDPAYMGFLTRTTVLLFLVWLVFCVVMTAFEIWPIGNAAHVSGLIIGALLGFLLSKTNWQLFLLTGVLAMGIAVGSVFWAPWSTSWMSHHAYRLDVEGRDKEAAVLYEKVIKRNPDANWARENLQTIHIHEISILANQAFVNQEWDKANDLYDQILVMEPDNEFALLNKELIRGFLENPYNYTVPSQPNFREMLSGVPQSKSR